MESRKQQLILVTHTDLDGEAAAAAYLRISSTPPNMALVFFAEPYSLHETMEDVVEIARPGDKVVIMDIGYNSDSTPRALELIDKLVREGVTFEWYDHHVWGDDEASSVLRTGVRLFIDRSTCGAGVVIRYASKVYGVQPDDYLTRLESAVCSADLWTWKDPMAPRLMRASGSSNGQAKARWRLRMIEKLYSGVMWDDELNSRLIQYLSEELRNSTNDLSTASVSRSGSCSAAAVLRRTELPSDSIIGSAVISRKAVDVAVIVKRKSFGEVSLSLRSRGSANVQVIAKALGGGGHPRAAGASLRVNPLLYIAGLFVPRLITRYVSAKIVELGERLGACRERESGNGTASEGGYY